jgi:type III secretion system FlhB-like substrate exporter
MEKKIIGITDTIKTPFCVASGDGDIIFEIISDAIRNKQHVELSFKDIKYITSAFLNSAIGQLYGVFSGDDITSFLRLIDLKEIDSELILRVKENAIRFYENKEKAMKPVYEELGSDFD